MEVRTRRDLFGYYRETDMTQVPCPPPPYGQTPPVYYQKPHRGTMILVFGILSWVCCFIFGILAWVMGNRDLREMDAGIMDPAGRETTKAGRLVGMIHIIVACCVLGIYLVIAIIALIAGGIGFATHVR
jgi:hypothetical protein